jgi:alpha-L-fucosidase
MNLYRLQATLLACFSFISLNAQISEKALQDWKDNKFSMFIHFGMYAQLGGVWEGKNISKGLSEQIQAHAGIYSDTYENVAASFNPVKWNPDSIVTLAKNAGMRSIVITSKHHDGFCMFQTSTTDFNIVEATPYKRDVLKELSAACRKQGMNFGLYFSLIDWHFPQAAPISSHNSDIVTPEHHEYNKKQLTELLTGYGPITELWFDMGSQTIEQSSELRDLVHQLQPDCMIGSRIGNDQGDFTVMGDNQEPDYAIGVPWQSPASFFDETWGYRSWQVRTDPSEKLKEKLTSLIRVVSRGGNYLLNIGPRGDGTVVEYERDILLQIGDWLKTNTEAVYGTSPDPFHIPFPWGSISSRKDKLYLFVMKNAVDGKILLPGLQGKLRSAYVLDNKQAIKTSVNSNGLMVSLPDKFDVSENFRVIVLEFKDGYNVPAVNIQRIGKDALQLNRQTGFNYYSNSTIDYNTSFQSIIRQSWSLLPEKTGSLDLEISYTQEEKDQSIELELQGSRQIISLNNGEAHSLSNDARISWGPMKIQGPYSAGIGGMPDLDSSKWVIQRDWKNGYSYTPPANKMQAWYIQQEIDSDKKSSFLVEFTTGDGLVVWLNDRQLYIRSNPEKTDSMKHTVLLPLLKGKNKLVVKSFNHLHKQVPINIDNTIPQIFYVKKLAPLPVQKNQLIPVSWKLHQSITPHQDMAMPGLTLTLKYQ